MHKGIVSSISSFPYQNKTLWSFQLNGVRAFYRTGEKHPGIEKGNYVEFEATGPDVKGNFQVDVTSIKVGDAPQTAKGPTGFRKAFTEAPKKDFPTKEERDATQARIEIQSCRNSALQFIDILIKTEAFKLPAKNKIETLESLLEHYIQQFLARNQGKIPTPESKEATTEWEGV